MDRETEMYHAAIKILSNRIDQLELNDDELAHDGRKGMKWGKNIFGKDDEKNKKQDNGFHPILNFKKEQMLRKARKEEHGSASEYVPQGPNSVTAQELSDYKTDRQNKKNGLLNRAYAERDLRTEKSNSDNRKSQADLYYKTFDDNISRKVDSFIQNDPNVKLYDSLMKDESVNRNDFGDGVGVKMVKNKISGSGRVKENREKSMSELDSVIREKMYQEIDKQIDQNLSGVYSDTMIQNMKTTAHGKADEMLDSYKQERSNYYTPGLVKNSEGKYVGFNGEEHDSDVSETARASADKLASQTAFSFGDYKPIPKKTPIESEEIDFIRNNEERLFNQATEGDLDVHERGKRWIEAARNGRDPAYKQRSNVEALTKFINKYSDSEYANNPQIQKDLETAQRLLRVNNGRINIINNYVQNWGGIDPEKYLYQNHK